MKKKIPITHYLLEIKFRVIYIIFSFISTFISAYIYSEQILKILATPLFYTYEIKDLSFIYTHLTEAFLSYLKISFFASLLFTFPIILIQIWMFLIPGLFYYERKKITCYFFITFFFIIMGLLLGYFFILPTAWKFFLSFELYSHKSISIYLQPKIDQYFSLVIDILLIITITFHFPIYIYIFLKSNLIHYKWFLLKRNISLIIIFIIGAVISPPDILSQFFIGIPFTILYEIIMFLIIIQKEYKKYFLKI